MTKYLVLGSAPYVSEWVDCHLNWFVEHDYKLVTFNNSWRLIDLDLIHEYHMSDNHETAGTFVMNHEIRRQLGPRLVRHVSPNASDEDVKQLTQDNINYRVKPSKYGNNTMFFDMVQYFIDHHVQADIVFIGCDMMYRNDVDTFYNHVPGHKARPDIVLAYDNDFGRVALEFQYKFEQKPYGLRFWNASEHDSRLPFERFRDHLDESPSDTWSP